LTERELDVLRLLAQGKTNTEIAAALFISPRTVGVHVSSLLRKLDATTRVQAATVAGRAGASRGRAGRRSARPLVGLGFDRQRFAASREALPQLKQDRHPADR
jgi:DNA-binding CsgD family transcriptional regulator